MENSQPNVNPANTENEKIPEKETIVTIDTSSHDESIKINHEMDMGILQKAEEVRIEDQITAIQNEGKEQENKICVEKNEEITNEEEMSRRFHPRPETKEEEEMFPSVKKFKSAAKRSPDEKPFANKFEVSTITFDKHSPPTEVGEEKQRISVSKPFQSISPIKGSALKGEGSKGKGRFSTTPFNTEINLEEKKAQEEIVGSVKKSEKKSVGKQTQTEKQEEREAVTKSEDEILKEEKRNKTESKESKKSRDSSQNGKENKIVENVEEEASIVKEGKLTKEVEDEKPRGRRTSLKKSNDDDEDIKDFFKKSETKSKHKSRKHKKSKTPAKKSNSKSRQKF